MSELSKGIVPVRERQDSTKGKSQKQVAREAIEALERLGGAIFREEDIVYAGNKLTLPEGMSIKQGIAFLQKKEAELTVPTDFYRVFKYRPLDVAYCTWNAMMRAFGSVSHQSRTVQTFFGPQKAPPQLIDVPVNAYESIQVPWGNFVIPYLPQVEFELGGTGDDEFGAVGYLNAQGPKRWQDAVHGVFEMVERELRERSLYRGKAFDGRPNPQFIDLSKHDPAKMVFAEQTGTQLNASLWGALVHRDVLARKGIPFKRAVLLSGDFGVGKSLAINETGRVCESEEVTFILVRPGRDSLRDAMMTARIYQPAVVAFEDVDIITDADQDARKITEVLDLFDGIEAKSTEIMLVLTTNHKEKLHKGMLRPGRLDAIIEIGPPDAKGIQRLIEVNIGDQLSDDIDWDLVGEAMEGYLPAFVVEAAHLAVRYSIIRAGVGADKIETHDLVAAGYGLRPQFDLMTDARTEQAKAPSLDEALRVIAREESSIAAERTANAMGRKLPDLEQYLANRNKV